jgi:hypothetical protein
MNKAINLLQKKIITTCKGDPQFICGGNISTLSDALVYFIDDNIFSAIFNTEIVNELEYDNYSLSTNNLFLFLSKLHEANIKFSYNKFMMKQAYYKNGAPFQLSIYNKIFDYLYSMNEFDSYEFIYCEHTSIHILETIKINYQIDHFRLINECLKSSNEEIIIYLLKYVDDMSCISIDYIMKYGQNMTIINKFITSGLNIEILHCPHNNRTISKLFDNIDIRYIHLIKQINISRYSYGYLLCKIAADKIDELLSHGCLIFFIEDAINLEDTDEVMRVNNNNIKIYNKLRVLEAHNIDLQFIMQHYVLDTYLK